MRDEQRGEDAGGEQIEAPCGLNRDIARTFGDDEVEGDQEHLGHGQLAQDVQGGQGFRRQQAKVDQGKAKGFGEGREDRQKGDKQGKAGSLPQSDCRPVMTEISSMPKIGSKAARSRGANHAIGNRISRARLAIFHSRASVSKNGGEGKREGKADQAVAQGADNAAEQEGAEQLQQDGRVWRGRLRSGRGRRGHRRRGPVRCRHR